MRSDIARIKFDGRQYGLVRSPSNLTQLISLYNAVEGLVARGAHEDKVERFFRESLYCLIAPSCDVEAIRQRDLAYADALSSINRRRS